MYLPTCRKNYIQLAANGGGLFILNLPKTVSFYDYNYFFL